MEVAKAGFDRRFFADPDMTAYGCRHQTHKTTESDFISNFQWNLQIRQNRAYKFSRLDYFE